MTEAIAAAEAKGYSAGVAAAEALVRRRITITRWASDARLLKIVADAVHRLLPDPTPPEGNQ